MTQCLVTGLRGIEIGVPDLELAARFYADTWHLTELTRRPEKVYFRGTGAAHHILTLTQSEHADVRAIEFDVAEIGHLDTIARAVEEQGGTVLSGPAPTTMPGAGVALDVLDPQGRTLRFIAGGRSHADTEPVKDRPIKITHVVLNSENVAVAQAFFEKALGFRLSDRTRVMAFMRCGSDHHSIALADAQENSLNHIAFVMPDLDSVMRGGGRMNDAGHPIEWGVGRHGPGNNVFAYFLGPFDFVIEYTAEVQQVDESYRTGGPDDWKWPPGRIDQWGVGRNPSDRMKAAQKTIFFRAPQASATGSR
ncbi:VOC family protein [Paraburkholderia sp. J94]|uniref:VOC family protein n=1 Tax=Paraburkholderia sp. J94 TaxID=2805441 RepID=UPI002AAFCDAA|nr:VOC family protein [Paraburkholderia sp. J94]